MICVTPKHNTPDIDRPTPPSAALTSATAADSESASWQMAKLHGQVDGRADRQTDAEQQTDRQTYRQIWEGADRD
jgi:hypothetical protein